MFPIFSVKQGTVAVITTWGRYSRLVRPGLGFRIPFAQKIHSRVSIQHQSMELSFQAITQDQANVYFKAMLLYATINDSEESVKKVAFKFINKESLTIALVRTVEAITRGYVATQKQAEILGLRAEIVAEAKSHLDGTLADWGYHLIDLQLNDITFDEVITRSMATVVASANLRAAAVNEGEAVLIRETKAAEARGAAIRITSEAEAIASQRRGQGVRMFRTEVAAGLAEASRTVEQSGASEALVLFAMWTETIRDAAEHGQGNVIFLDGSIDGMDHSLQRLLAMNQAAKSGQLDSDA